jgi:archaellum component FlaC
MPEFFGPGPISAASSTLPIIAAIVAIAGLIAGAFYAIVHVQGERIKETRGDLDTRVTTFSETLGTRIDAAEQHLDRRITDLGERIDQLDRHVERRIDALSDKLENQINAMSERLETSYATSAGELGEKINNLGERLERVEASQP